MPKHLFSSLAREYTPVIAFASAKLRPYYLGDFSNWHMLCYCNDEAVSVAKQNA